LYVKYLVSRRGAEDAKIFYAKKQIPEYIAGNVTCDESNQNMNNIFSSALSAPLREKKGFNKFPDCTSFHPGYTNNEYQYSNATWMEHQT
jgi:hypothetical protein